MPNTRVPIGELRIGMYVAALDLPWYRSPFLRHSFKVERQEQITKLLRAGVKIVDIDLDRGISPRLEPATTEQQPPTVQTQPAQEKKPIKTLAQLNEEYAQAALAKQQLTQSVQSVFTKIASTGTVNPQQAADAVHEITIVTRTLTPSSMFMALSQNRAGDPMLSQHALTTCTLALILGQTFQFNPLELQELATAALLHDIGLLQIAPSLVRHVHADQRLSPVQQREFESHPRLGVRSLQQAGSSETAVLHLIANHHAYLDDSGYPKEARGEFTSDRTRILMIVDRYDELLTGFGGATPLPSHRTFQRLYQEARQNKLDQQLLSAFIGLVGVYPVHSQVRLNTKERGVVTTLNQETLHQPVVTITHQPEGTTYPDPFTVNLADQPASPQPRAIEAVIEL